MKRQLLLMVLMATALLLLSLDGNCAQAGPTTAPAASQPEVYQDWPFSAEAARKRQRATAEALGQPQQKLLNLGQEVRLELVLIPAGKFTMGSPPDKEYPLRDNEVPKHEVIISRPFYIGKYEVTQSQYERVMKANPSDFSAPGNPVEQVLVDEASEFCRKVSKMTASSIRLPTEAEWEYVCRAGTETLFCWGDKIDTEKANYDGTFVPHGERKGQWRKRTTVVGSFEPNAFGIYDMHGNVAELCADWYDKTFYERSPKKDPLGPPKGDMFVSRGGSYVSPQWWCRSAARDVADPVRRNFHVGFRVVLDVP